MNRFFKKDQVLTIPNLLSTIRLLLIPLIVWLYIGKQAYTAATIVLLLSAATDTIDGYIARRFNMVSDLGKILDPVADKLTQAAMIICLMSKYSMMRTLFALFVVKELTMLAFGYITIRKCGTVNSAKWYGKLSTAVFYTVMAILVLFPAIPDSAANILIIASGCVMLLSLVLYTRFYIILLKPVSSHK